MISRDAPFSASTSSATLGNESLKGEGNDTLHPLPQAPPASAFPVYPISWYFFSAVSELRRRPLSRDIFGRRVVVYRTESGRLAALDARCSHMGTDLGNGCVLGESLQCPYHNWEFAPDGRCVRIPAQENIPAFARQRAYPVVERQGYIFIFNAPEPLFDLPFYEGMNPDQMICSKPAETILDCAWYLCGSNAFDLQHFRAAHDRRMIGEPVVDCPVPFARRATARFSVSGNSFLDKLTRAFAGNEVKLSITDYCGNMMLATATFRRTRSYGFVVNEPLGENCVRVRIMVLVPRSRNFLLRLVFDRLSLAIRHKAICHFLSSDASRLTTARYYPHRFIEADLHLIEYFQWLAATAHGHPRVAGKQNGRDDSDENDAPFQSNPTIERKP